MYAMHDVRTLSQSIENGPVCRGAACLYSTPSKLRGRHPIFKKMPRMMPQWTSPRQQASGKATLGATPCLPRTSVTKGFTFTRCTTTIRYNQRVQHSSVEIIPQWSRSRNDLGAARKPRETSCVLLNCDIVGAFPHYKALE